MTFVRCSLFIQSEGRLGRSLPLYPPFLFIPFCVGFHGSIANWSSFIPTQLLLINILLNIMSEIANIDSIIERLLEGK